MTRTVYILTHVHQTTVVVATFSDLEQFGKIL